MAKCSVQNLHLYPLKNDKWFLDCDQDGKISPEDEVIEITSSFRVDQTDFKLVLKHEKVGSNWRLPQNTALNPSQKRVLDKIDDLAEKYEILKDGTVIQRETLDTLMLAIAVFNEASKRNLYIACRTNQRPALPTKLNLTPTIKQALDTFLVHPQKVCPVIRSAMIFSEQSIEIVDPRITKD